MPIPSPDPALRACRVLTVLLGLPLLARADDPAPATFTRDVAPIVFQNCASCHRPGQGAPFSLLSYDDARKRAHLIEEVTSRQTMPPWPPAAGWGHFQDQRRLTDQQIDTISRWVQAGTPEGPPDALPALPTFPPEGWMLGKPDRVVTLDQPYDIPADGPDLYRLFVFPLDEPEDRWVTAVEIRPTAPAVVHHALYFLDDTGASRRLDVADPAPGFGRMSFPRTGSLGGWAVGATPRHLPMGLAYPLPKGSDLVVQVHFHPSGKPEREQLSIGLYYAKQKPSKSLLGAQAPLAFGAGTALRSQGIAPGEKNFTINGEWTAPFDIDVVAIGGHAHYLCRTMKAVAVKPDGQEEKLLAIDDWDFNWQGRYNYEQPVRLPRGTRIKTTLVYDNSEENPRNPSHPPRHVRWGEQSNDEMGSIGIAFTAVNESDIASDASGSFFTGGDQVGRLSSIRRGMGLLREVMGPDAEGQTLDPARFRRQLEARDANGDGKLSGEEIPERLRPFADRIDANGDGALDRDEIREALSRFLNRSRSAESRAPARKPAATPEPGPAVDDIDGQTWYPFTPAQGVKGQVLVFTTRDCPVANHFAPEVARIARDYHDQGIRLLLVHVDPETTADQARAHAAEYGLDLPVLLDPDHALVKRAGVKVTPEAALIAADGRLLYTGRIDDRFRTLGRQTPEPAHRDLRDSIDALLAGRPVPNPRVDAVGCPIADLR